MWIGSLSSLSALDAAAGHMVEALPPRDFGQETYRKYCLRCHGIDKQAVRGAPLTSRKMQRYTIQKLMAKLRTHCRGNPASPYTYLEVYEQLNVVRYLLRTRFGSD
jgi:cytochrome c553